MPEGRQVADASHRSGVPATEEKDARQGQGPKLPFKVVQQRTHALVDGMGSRAVSWRWWEV